MNGDVITWDDDTLEVNINGQDYPGSSIVDILNYLTDKNSNDLFYMTGDTISFTVIAIVSHALPGQTFIG